MGIEGLLVLLKPITVKSHIQNFSGKTAAIDASAWLYKGLYSCSWELATGMPTYGYLNYPIKMVNMLLKNSVKPILVFDGLTLPLKENAIKKRKSDKVKNKELAEKYLAEGKKELAASMFARAMSVKSEMIHTFMDVLHKMHVEYIVAPFEADAQIAYLCKEGMADFAISEDSDLVVYGCKSMVLKLDAEGGCENIVLGETFRNEEYMKGVPEGPVKDMAALPEHRFMELCIISGCDYLSNIHGFGMKKALKMLKDYTLEEIIGKIQYKKQFMGKVPADFLKNVERIKLQFLNGRVIDPRTYKMIEITPLPSTTSPEDAELLGNILDPDVVEAFALGLYSFKKNIYRKRLTDEEIELILKDMANANRAKKYVENKKSLNEFTTELKMEAKAVAAKIIEGAQSSKNEPEEEVKEEEIKKEPNASIISELDSLAASIKIHENAQTNIKSEAFENVSSSPIKHNPFAKELKTPENNKKTFYSLFQGDSLSQFFKRETKRFKEDTEAFNANFQ